MCVCVHFIRVSVRLCVYMYASVRLYVCLHVCLCLWVSSDVLDGAWGSVLILAPIATVVCRTQRSDELRIIHISRIQARYSSHSPVRRRLLPFFSSVHALLFSAEGDRYRRAFFIDCQCVWGGAHDGPTHHRLFHQRPMSSLSPPVMRLLSAVSILIDADLQYPLCPYPYPMSCAENSPIPGVLIFWIRTKDRKKGFSGAKGFTERRNICDLYAATGQ